MKVDVGIVEEGLNMLCMYTDGKPPAAIATEVIDVIVIARVVLLYVHGTERTPNKHDICVSCTEMAVGTIICNELYAGIGLLLVAVIVKVVG